MSMMCYDLRDTWVWSKGSNDYTGGIGHRCMGWLAFPTEASRIEHVHGMGFIGEAQVCACLDALTRFGEVLGFCHCLLRLIVLEAFCCLHHGYLPASLHF